MAIDHARSENGDIYINTTNAKNVWIW